jgi:hypothetical protein
VRTDGAVSGFGERTCALLGGLLVLMTDLGVQDKSSLWVQEPLEAVWEAYDLTGEMYSWNSAQTGACGRTFRLGFTVAVLTGL